MNRHATTVNDIEHVDSQSLPGVGVVKIYSTDRELQHRPGPGDLDLQNHPEAASPGGNAADHPGLQCLKRSNHSALALFERLRFRRSSSSISPQNFIRPQLATVAGAQLPYAYGGATRQVQIDLDQNALRAHNLSAIDVGNALALQNQINPVGTEKIGSYEFTVDLNNSPKAMADFD